jgi:hypothetical protein
MKQKGAHATMWRVRSRAGQNEGSNGADQPNMEQILALRPLIPAADFPAKRRKTRAT